MRVTAKFKVYSVSTIDYGTGKETQVDMSPDYAEGRNAEWAAATPTGNIRLTISPTKTSATNLFKPGTALTVTFEAEDKDVS